MRDTDTVLPPTPKPILRLALVLSLGVILVGGWGVLSSVRSGSWLQLGFELVLVVAGGFGVMTGIGHNRASHPMALACVAGSVFVAAVMAFIASPAAQGNAKPALMLRAMAGDRETIILIGLGLALAALSGLILLGRRPGESMWYLGLGVLLGAPSVIGLAFVLAPSLRAKLTGLSPMSLSAVIFVGFFIVGGLLSASLHCLIRAFEIGRIDPLEPPRGSAGDTSA